MIKTWKNHREKILYERELSMMPETQIYVEKIIELEKKENEKKSRHKKNRMGMLCFSLI